MLGRILRALKGGGNGAKAIHVLRKTYSLSVTHPQHIDMMKRISNNFGEVYNEHEMAVQFLAQFIETIKTDHPQAHREVIKYIRMAKGAQNRGLVESEVVMEELFKVAKIRFGIDAESINAV